MKLSFFGARKDFVKYFTKSGSEVWRKKGETGGIVTIRGGKEPSWIL
jgi:hypothetical protein